MIKIQIDHDIEEITAKLGKVEPSKWTKILAYASNETGFYVRNKMVKEMPKYLDRPKPFTLNSLFVKKGNSKDPEAVVLWKPGSLSGNSAGRYLVPQADGGSRKLKKFENLLQMNRILPFGQFLIPTKDAPMDQYGNVPGSFIVKIISYLRAFRDNLQNRNLNPEKAKRKKLQYFVVRPGDKNRAGLSAGIYERISLFGGAIRKVFFFSARAQYKSKFPFGKIAKDASLVKFDQKLDEGIKKALDGEKGF